MKYSKTDPDHDKDAGSAETPMMEKREMPMRPMPMRNPAYPKKMDSGKVPRQHGSGKH